MKKYHWASFDRFEFKLPVDCVNDCSAQGSVDESVEYWQQKLNLGLDRQLMIAELTEYGAWSIDELNGYENSELEQKLIWIGSGNIKEELNNV